MPANLPENVHASGFTHLSVTPKPAQVQMPVWVVASDEDAVGGAARLGLPLLGTAADSQETLRSKFDRYRSLAGEAPWRALALVRDVDVTDVDRCIEEIAGYRNELGVSYLICRFDTAEPGERMRAVELFGKTVIPEFRMFGFPAELRSRCLEKASP